MTFIIQPLPVAQLSSFILSLFRGVRWVTSVSWPQSQNAPRNQAGVWLCLLLRFEGRLQIVWVAAWEHTQLILCCIKQRRLSPAVMHNPEFWRFPEFITVWGINKEGKLLFSSWIHKKRFMGSKRPIVDPPGGEFLQLQQERRGRGEVKGRKKEGIKEEEIRWRGELQKRRRKREGSLFFSEISLFRCVECRFCVLHRVHFPVVQLWQRLYCVLLGANSSTPLSPEGVLAVLFFCYFPPPSARPHPHTN